MRDELDLIQKWSKENFSEGDNYEETFFIYMCLYPKEVIHTLYVSMQSDLTVNPFKELIDLGVIKDVLDSVRIKIEQENIDITEEKEYILSVLGNEKKQN